MNGPTISQLPEWVRKAPLHCENPLGAARALRPIIQEGSAAGERNSYVPDEVMKALADAGLFGIQVPKSLGGSGLSPAQYFDVLEELSYADGSTGWVIMALTSAIESVFRSGEGVLAAGQISKLGKAEPEGNGYRISGDFLFGSGSWLASWFLGAFAVERNGKPVLNDDGKPRIVIGIVPRNSVRLTGNWDMIGLAATGSYDFRVEEQFLPPDFLVDMKGLSAVAPVFHAAWAVGVARRALDEIKGRAVDKRRFGRTTLIDQPVFQFDYARHRAAMAAARSHAREINEAWASAYAEGRSTLELRADARLAGCWVTKMAKDAVEFAYLASGSHGLRNYGGSNAQQRCFRDMYAGTQHRQIDDNVALDAARVMLGVAEADIAL